MPWEFWNLGAKLRSMVGGRGWWWVLNSLHPILTELCNSCTILVPGTFGDIVATINTGGVFGTVVMAPGVMLTVLVMSGRVVLLAGMLMALGMVVMKRAMMVKGTVALAGRVLLVADR